MSDRAVFGIMKDEASVQRMRADLRSAGFAEAEMSVMMASQRTPRAARPQAPLGCARATAGGGEQPPGLLDGLAGVGALAIPGFEPLIAAGPIVAALAGAAVGAAMASVAGGLIGLGIPDAHAKRYEGKLRDGKLLVAVHTRGVPPIAAATTVLETHDAQHIVVASGSPLLSR